MRIQGFFDEITNTMSYVVLDEATRDAVVLDPVLDFDPASGHTSDKALRPILAMISEQRLNVRLLLETHAHADHLSASQPLKARFGSAPLAIGEGIRGVQRAIAKLLDLGPDFPVDGRQFDRLLHPGEEVQAGSLRFLAVPTPGHTPACMSYLFQDAVFTGDALFMPDYGTGRCDFPGGSPADLFRSISQKLYKLPDATRVFTCHDYRPGGRPLRYESTIGEEKRANIQLNATTTEEAFVAFRQARDRTLDAPKLLYPSIQVNVDGGRLPAANSNGHRYLKMPISG